MNAAAKTMGLSSTHFSQYDGVPYPTEFSTYSSPADLIWLGAQAMRNPVPGGGYRPCLFGRSRQPA